jgi:hypothetical protein
MSFRDDLGYIVPTWRVDPDIQLSAKKHCFDTGTGGRLTIEFNHFGGLLVHSARTSTAASAASRWQLLAKIAVWP